MVVILLSILIAQFNHSFEEQQERATIAIASTRLRLLKNMDSLVPKILLKVSVMIRLAISLGVTH